MSTPATQPNAAPSWKQEVNQRLAAHKSRHSAGPAAARPPAGATQAANSRAAKAAARVAARFAQAPSYSQMLAGEARAAMRAAEAASQAALQAQAAAQSILAGLEAVSGLEPAREPRIGRAETREQPFPSASNACFDPIFAPPQTAAPAPGTTVEGQPLEIRWEPDMPVRPAEPRAARAPSEVEHIDFSVGTWHQLAAITGEPETVEPAQPIHANLIEFPRELVAPRKARPRIAEGPFAAASTHGGQLSIFEVDPGAISIEPAPVDAATEPAAPDWSSIKLDAEPVLEPPLPEPAQEIAPAPQAPAIHLAPLAFRLMASLVDGALITAAFLVAALVAAANIAHPPAVKTIEVAALAAMFATGVLYQLLFCTLATATPGMRYAGLSLCTFDDRRPTRAQMRRRLGALLLSLLPVGLGALWAIFDEDHLSWHDRLSGTYPRRG